MALSSILLIIFILPIFLKCHAKISSVIVFGDSTVDTGNNNAVATPLKSNFQPYGRDFEGGKSTGRFSNGRVPSDFISKAFGLKPLIPAYLDSDYSIKDFATGVCFASAGTGYDEATSRVLNVVSLEKELEYYKEYQSRLRSYMGEEKANQNLREALYLISIGTNDFLANYYLLPSRALQYSVEEYQKFLADKAKNFLKRLYELGARKISLTGLPPMGCVPLERASNALRGGTCVDEYNSVALNFNRKLRDLVQNLNRELPGIRIVFSTPYDIVYDMISNPQSHGFEQVAKACCGTGFFEMSYLCNKLNPLTCRDASKYVFWDAFHLTEKANAIISDYVFKQLGVFK